MVKVGDRMKRTPRIDSVAGVPVRARGPQPCVVVWVHPAGRFYVVEFTSEVTGEKFRETVYMQPCEYDKAVKERKER